MDLFHHALTVWEWDPSLVIGLAIWELGYLWFTSSRHAYKFWGPTSLSRKISFTLGTLTAFLALVSPLDYIADHYLFSAHMVQHLLLILVAPPLWLLGLPEGFPDRLPLPMRLRSLAFWLTRPVIAFVLFNFVLLAWHIPRFYETTLENNGLHIIEHLSFMAAAVIGWWPVLGRSNQVAPRASHPIQILYMFLMMFPSTLLGVLFTFARVPLIPYYVRAPRLWELAANPGQPFTTFGTSSGGWGLSVMDDQQAAGLVMWVPGNMVMMLALFLVLFAWFQEDERKGFSPDEDQDG